MKYFRHGVEEKVRLFEHYNFGPYIDNLNEKSLTYVLDAIQATKNGRSLQTATQNTKIWVDTYCRFEGEGSKVNMQWLSSLFPVQFYHEESNKNVLMCKSKDFEVTIEGETDGKKLREFV